MTLQSRLSDLITAIGSDIKAINTSITKLMNGRGIDFPCSVDLAAVVNANSIAMQAANGAIFMRVRNGGVITKVGFIGVTTMITTTMSIAFYANTGSGRNSAPGALLGTTGSFTLPTTAGYNEQALTSTTTVNDGDWVAISCSSVTPTFRCVGAGAGDNNLGKGSQYRSTAAVHPLTGAAPALASLVATFGYNIALVGVA